MKNWLWIIKGHAYKVIADELHISEKTVSKHVSNMFAKVSVTTRIELIKKIYSAASQVQLAAGILFMPLISSLPKSVCKYAFILLTKTVKNAEFVVCIADGLSSQSVWPLFWSHSVFSDIPVIWIE